MAVNWLSSDPRPLVEDQAWRRALGVRSRLRRSNSPSLHGGREPTARIHATCRLDPWRWAREGCELVNDTTQAISDAGFSSVELETFTMRGVFVPVRTQVAGVAMA